MAPLPAAMQKDDISTLPLFTIDTHGSKAASLEGSVFDLTAQFGGLLSNDDHTGQRPTEATLNFEAMRTRIQQQLEVTVDDAKEMDNSLLSGSTQSRRSVETAPLFCLDAAAFEGVTQGKTGDTNDPFVQYGVVGHNLTVRAAHWDANDPTHTRFDNAKSAILANMNIPWSAFICGSQGGGKSHTLSCLLENGLLQSDRIGSLPNPLAAMVFHYDTYTKGICSQVCEAAYLCSAGIPVRVLVAPSNIWAMKKLYTNLPGLPQGATKPKVMPLYLSESSLDVTTMLKLMAVDPNSNDVPLYMEIVMNILREMAMEGKGSGAFSYSEFRARLESIEWTASQRVPLDLRLQLLDSCLEPSEFSKTNRPASSTESIWSFAPGSLTIVDLSDPFIGSNEACSLFAICLSNFLEDRSQCGRVVALDEAHKFLTQSGAARTLTNDLTSIIRQQRHTGTRVLIATQEPTLAPELIDLCNVTFVHRFLSPAWYEVLKKHLAGANKHDSVHNTTGSLFDKIISLNTGEALLFCPTAVLPTQHLPGNEEIKPLGSGYVHVRVRKRVTFDGGRSILASEAAQRTTQKAPKSDIPMHIVNKNTTLPSADKQQDIPETIAVGAVMPAFQASAPDFKKKQKQRKPSPKISIFPQNMPDIIKEPPKESTNISIKAVEEAARKQMRRNFKQSWHDKDEISWDILAKQVEVAMKLDRGTLQKNQQHLRAIRHSGADEYRKCREK